MSPIHWVLWDQGGTPKPSHKSFARGSSLNCRELFARHPVQFLIFIKGDRAPLAKCEMPVVDAGRIGCINFGKSDTMMFSQS